MKYLSFGALTGIAAFTAVVSAATYIASGDAKAPIAETTAPTKSTISLFDPANMLRVSQPERSFTFETLSGDTRVKHARLAAVSSGTASSTDLSTAAATYEILAMSAAALPTAEEWTSDKPTFGYGVKPSSTLAIGPGKNGGSYLFSEAGLAPYANTGEQFALVDAVGTKAGSSARQQIADFARQGAAPLQSNNASAVASTAQIAAVPLPAGALMMLLGLGSLRLIRRKTG